MIMFLDLSSCDGYFFLFKIYVNNVYLRDLNINLEDIVFKEC